MAFGEGWFIGLLIVLAAFACVLRLSTIAIKHKIAESKKYSLFQLFTGRAWLGQISGYDEPVSKDESYLKMLKARKIMVGISLLVLVVYLIIYFFR